MGLALLVFFLITTGVLTLMVAEYKIQLSDCQEDLNEHRKDIAVLEKEVDMLREQLLKSQKNLHGRDDGSCH